MALLLLMNSTLIGKNSNQKKEDKYRKHLTGNILTGNMPSVSFIQGQDTQGKGMGGKVLWKMKS